LGWITGDIFSSKLGRKYFLTLGCNIWFHGDSISRNVIINTEFCLLAFYS
jgi:hypothetical protein